MAGSRWTHTWMSLGALLLAASCGSSTTTQAEQLACNDQVDLPPPGAPGACPEFRAQYTRCEFIHTPVPLAPPVVTIAPIDEGLQVTVRTGSDKVIHQFIPDGARRASVEAELDGDFPALKRVWCGDPGLVARYLVEPESPNPTYKEIQLQTPAAGQLRITVEQRCKLVFEVRCAG